MSEVYLTYSDPTTLANVTFHECMHNKLQLDNRMHNSDGLRKGDPQGGLGPGDTISATNIRRHGAGYFSFEPAIRGWIWNIDQRRSKPRFRRSSLGQRPPVKAAFAFLRWLKGFVARRLICVRRQASSLR
jgi:hypothetical protein